MSAPQFSHCLFCDDIRFEIGNKLSLMGVYNADLIIPDKFPALLPKLGIVVYLMSDIDDPPEKITTTVVLPDGNEFLRFDLPRSNSVQNLEGATKLVMSQTIPISPLPIPCQGMLEVWVETEKGKTRAGRLKIHSG
jgi:hypothetical protein